VLSCRYAVKAVEMIERGIFGHMVAKIDEKMIAVPIDEVIKTNKYVTPDNELIKVCKLMGISFAEA
jgi:6-phosphofructokinase 1